MNEKTDNEAMDYEEKPKRGVQQDHNNGRNFGGLVLIILGLIFFFMQSNPGLPLFDNWWALFILVPGVLSGVRAYNTYQEEGPTNAFKGLISGSLFTIVIGLIFLFELDWGRIWPVFLVIPGILMLLGWNKD